MKLRLLSIVMLFFIFNFIEIASAQSLIGKRSEQPGAFLHWPLPSEYTVKSITRLPDTPWTWNFLGIYSCPSYPALIKAGNWYDGKSYGGNRNVIKPNVTEAQVKWVNAGKEWFDNAIACYGNHAGTDISAPDKTPILAAADGVLRYDTTSMGSKRLYMIHDNVNGSGQKWFTIYLHAINIRSDLLGKFVSKGTKIGEVGSRHLHFEVNRNTFEYYSNSRNPWGIDQQPWDGCLWVDRSICQSPQTTFNIGQGAQAWNNVDAGSWRQRFLGAFNRAGLNDKDDYGETSASSGTQIVRRSKMNNAPILLVANTTSKRVVFVRRGFARFMMNNGYPMNQPAGRQAMWGSGIQGPPTSDEVYIDGVAHLFFQNGYLRWNQDRQAAEFIPYDNVNINTTWWCRYWNGALDTGRSGAEACSLPDDGFTLNWGTGSYPGSLPNHWSFRTSRQLTFSGGQHAFELGVDSDSTATLYIAYQNDASTHVPIMTVEGTTKSVVLDMPAGNHIIRIDYSEKLGNAWLKFNHGSVLPDTPACQADVNGDNAVDMLDIQQIAGNPTNLRNDLNGDGVVNVLDIQQAASLYRQLCRS